MKHQAKKFSLKLIFSFSLLVNSLLAQGFNLNEKIEHFSLPDQFNKMHTISEKTETIIVSFEKDTGKMVNEFLESKQPDFLKNHHAVFIANISGMPSIITKLFALPKMQDYKHTILLIYNENDKRFIQKDEVSTIYSLKDGVIKSVNFVKNKEDLEKIF